jgi:hypothetical protein
VQESPPEHTCITVSGVVLSRQTGVPATGAAVVAMKGTRIGPSVYVDDGDFVIRLEGQDVLRIYFEDVEVDVPIPESCNTGPIYVGPKP